jgi:NAD(P)-dependent dehydrogenase (short-subunit alcohol dehydrogenase family)
MPSIAPLLDFADSTVVITGAARGIGFATAQAFHGAGATVLLVDLDEAAAAASAKELGDRAVSVGVDLTDARAPEVLSEAVTALPPLRAWINNAGVVSHNTADDVTLEEFESVQHKNSTTVLMGCQVARKHFGAFDDHAIVNISSEAALRSMARRISYGVSKTAVLGITRYLAHEWGPHKIRVNAICPGHIATRLTEFTEGTPDAAFHHQLLDSLPLARRGAPEDIAGAALFLSSHLATYVTGQALPVDGGWSAI